MLRVAFHLAAFCMRCVLFAGALLSILGITYAIAIVRSL